MWVLTGRFSQSCVKLTLLFDEAGISLCWEYYDERPGNRAWEYIVIDEANE